MRKLFLSRTHSSNNPSFFFQQHHHNRSHRRQTFRLAGTYVDLGSISNDGASPPLITSQDVAPPSTPALQSSSSIASNKSSRSDRWIVLIDDEPAIRLAVGDYLHSVAGFDTVTAVDGPMAFLDVCLWSCSWSLVSSPSSDCSTRHSPPPPWTTATAASGDGPEGGNNTRHRLWRLPDCVISDVRMPGGVDGIKLLQLMRHRPPPPTTSLTPTPTTTANDTSKQSPSAGRRKRGRSPKGGSTGSINNYDGKDEYDLMATIIDGIESSRNSASSSSSRRIVTPTDQAIQYMDAIHSCISYFFTNETNDSNANNVDHDGLLHSHQGVSSSTNNDGPTSLNDIPVILLTAKAMISDRIMGYGAGADGYLPKPFRPEELLGMVDNLLRRRQQRREQSRKDDDVRQRRQQQQSQQQQQQYELNNNGGRDDPGRDILDRGIIECLTPEHAREITNELIEIKKSIIHRQTGSSGGDSRIGTLFTRGTDEEEELMYQHYQSLLPQALWMYRTGERRKRIFTRDHIYSILVLCYNMEITSLTNKKKKNVGWDVLYKELYERYLECPERCDQTKI